jgi:hypothetical protein
VFIAGCEEGMCPDYCNTTPEEVEQERRLFFVGNDPGAKATDFDECLPPAAARNGGNTTQSLPGFWAKSQSICWSGSGSQPPWHDGDRHVGSHYAELRVTPLPLSPHQAPADGRERSSDFKRASEGVLLL